MRNRNIDILRTCALLIMMIYHAWVVCGRFSIENSIMNTLVMLGGEIGVTTFFSLSGYGIYCSLRNSEEKGGIKFKDFIKKRLIRVVPQYYLSLIVVVLFGVGANYLTEGWFWNFVTHVLFIHNLFPAYAGAINGVLWTMGVIVQFYFIAILLYKLTKRGGCTFYIVTILFTIIAKWVMFSSILPMYVQDSSLNFIYGRQLFTALDNFTTGMIVAHIVTGNKCRLNHKIAIVGLIVTFIGLYGVCSIGIDNGIHTNNISGYVWHSLLALVIGLLMFFVTFIQSGDNKFIKGVLWIAKYEYGIYLWHLVMYYNVVEKSQTLQSLLKNGNVWTVVIVLTSVSIGIGYLFSVLTDTFVADKIKSTKSETG